MTPRGVLIEVPSIRITPAHGGSRSLRLQEYPRADGRISGGSPDLQGKVAGSTGHSGIARAGLMSYRLQEQPLASLWRLADVITVPAAQVGVGQAATLTSAQSAAAALVRGLHEEA